MKKLLFSFFFVSILSVLNAQNTPIPTNSVSAISKVTAFHQKHQHALLTEYAAFLSLPNTMNDTASLMENAKFIMNMMKRTL